MNPATAELRSAEFRHESLGVLGCRKAGPADIPILGEWYSDPGSSRQLYSAPDDETEFACYILQPHRFIVTGDGTPVATFKIELQGSVAMLGILVAPEFRGLGVSKMALKLAEGEARALGHHSLSVDIYSDNEAAIAAFSSAGFREFVWYEKNI